MNTDIRIAVDFPDHPKTLRMVRRLGDSSFRCLVRLWTWTSRNRPSGRLSGMDAEGIADAAGWAGDAEQFVRELEACRWLDAPVNGTYSLHEWAEHEPWVIDAPRRSWQAKTGAHASNCKTKPRPDKCEICARIKRGQCTAWDCTASAVSGGVGALPACYEHTHGAAPAPAPSPTPTVEQESTPTPVSTPDWDAVARLVEVTDHASMRPGPDEQMLGIWVGMFGEQAVADLFRNRGPDLKGKHYKYVQTILQRQKDNPDEPTGTGSKRTNRRAASPEDEPGASDRPSRFARFDKPGWRQEDVDAAGK